jgi:hypothetical protein
MVRHLFIVCLLWLVDGVRYAKVKKGFGSREGARSKLDEPPNLQNKKCSTIGLKEVIHPPLELSAIQALADCEKLAQLELNFPSQMEYSDIGSFIDEFMMDRFEWQIIQEPYSRGDPHTVSLMKVPNKRLQKVGAVIRRHQFPQVCTSRNLYLMQDAGRFWGSLANLYQDVAWFTVIRPQSPIQMPYFLNWPMAYDKEYCKDRAGKNLWLCYFLPMSNCSVALPTNGKNLFVKNHDQDALVQGQNPDLIKKNYMDESTALPVGTTCKGNSKEEGGSKVESTPVEKSDPILATCEETSTTQFTNKWVRRNQEKIEACKQQQQQPGHSHCHDEFGTMTDEDKAFVTVQMLYRLNYRTRANVAKYKKDFFDETKWAAKQCTSVHVRRTDKVSGHCLHDPHNPAWIQYPGGGDEAFILQ